MLSKIITEAATALYQVTNPPPPSPSPPPPPPPPPSPPPPQIPDFTLTSAPPSANFAKIAVNSLQVPFFDIQQKFNTRIGETAITLEGKLREYNDNRKELIDNVEHCTDDKTRLSDEINDDKIGDTYQELIKKYFGYKTESEGLYKNDIQIPVRTIIDTGIDQLKQQNDTRKLFQTLRDNCSKFAGFITEHMNELENDVQDFNAAVDGYVKNKIPLFKKRLFACINRSIAVATTEIDRERGAVVTNIIDGLFGTGDNDIVKISRLLDELAKLEEDSP